MIFYESSHRIEDTLADMAMASATIGPRSSRELTKLFETVLDGGLAGWPGVREDANQRKGEFVVLVQGAPEAADAKVAERTPAVCARLCEPAALDRRQAGRRPPGAPRKGAGRRLIPASRDSRRMAPACENAPGGADQTVASSSHRCRGRSGLHRARCQCNAWAAQVDGKCNRKIPLTFARAPHRRKQQG